MAGEDRVAIQYYKTSIKTKDPGQSTGQETNWSNHLLAKPVKTSIQMYFPPVLGLSGCS